MSSEILAEILQRLVVLQLIIVSLSVETLDAVPLEVGLISVAGPDCKALPAVADPPFCTSEADQIVLL